MGILSNKLQHYISKLIENGKPGDKLPTDKEVALHSSVSEISVRRAMNRFSHSGQVLRIQGKGTYLPLTNTLEAKDTPSATTCDRLYDEIVSLIIHGKLKVNDPLPLQKNLRLNYSISQVDIRRTYQRLRQNGLATQIGRTWKVGRFLSAETHKEKTEILFFTQNTVHDLRSIYTNSPYRELFVQMENELIKNNCRISYESVKNLPLLVADFNRGAIKPVGLIFCGSDNGLVSVLDCDAVHKSLCRLEAHKSPLPSVLFITKDAFIKAPNYRFASISHTNTMSQRILANFIVQKGFTQVIFIVSAWQNIPGKEIIDCLRLFPELDKFGRGINLSYVIHFRSETSADFQSIYKTKYNFNEESIVVRMSKYRKVPIEEIHKITQVTTQPLLLQTQGFCPNTLLLFNEDEMASAALDLISQKGMSVPQDVSLVSVDNDASYFHRGLTVVTPDDEKNGYLLAHSLLNDIPVALSSRGYIATSSRLIQRKTSL